MTLRIAPGLELPDDAVTQAMAILARRGAGKTYTGSVLVEEVIEAGLPVCVIDPTGAWWGLRSSANGKKAGLQVWIFGGEHGDVPLERTAGKVIADVVVDHPGAYVLDLSSFESNAAQDQFVADFLERLYRAKAQRREALLLVVDEADSFAPQRPGPGQLRMLGALEAIVRRGRIRGLGVLLITQRAAVLNKNVLTQIEVLVAMQTTSPQDRAAIDAWIESTGSKEERAEVMGTLASLERGEAWFWSPVWMGGVLKRVKIRTRRTFDSSATPEAGAVAIAPQARAAVDLEALGQRIAASVEQAKANDPALLRKRIRELEIQVDLQAKAIADAPARTVEVPVEVRVEVPVFSDADRLALESAWVSASGAVSDWQDVVDRLAEMVRATRGPAPAVIPPKVVHARVVDVRRDRQVVVGELEDLGQSASAPDAKLSKAQRLMLSALAGYHPRPRSFRQLALLTGYAVSGGGFRNPMSALRTSGLIEGPKEAVSITPAGLAAVPDAEPLKTGAELLAMWLAQLDKGGRAILSVLAEAYPNALPKAEVAERAGYEVSGGGFRNPLSRLRTLELVEGMDPIRASADLFS